MSRPDRMAVSRRGMIRVLSVAGCAGVAARYLGAGPADAGAPPRATRSGAVPRGVRVVGEEYLARHPHEASRDWLRAAVPADPEGVRRRIERDFAEDDLVSVRGWLLSRTECRACALAVLTAAGPA